MDNHTVEQRVNRRMNRIKRLIAHGVLTLIIFYGILFAGAAEVITALPAVMIVLLLIFSLIAHGLWLGLPTLRETLTRQEEENTFYEKPKRSRLELSDDGELIDVDAEQQQVQDH